MFIAQASRPVQPVPSTSDRTSLPYVLPQLAVLPATLVWDLNDQCGKHLYIKRNDGGLIAGGGSKRAVPNEPSNPRTPKRAKYRPVGENCGEEESDDDDYKDRDFSADEKKDYQDHGDGKVLCPLAFKMMKKQEHEKDGVEKCLSKLSTQEEALYHALQRHIYCEKCRESLFKSGKNIEHLTLHEISAIFFNEHKHLKDHILRCHLNVFPCRIDNEDHEYCDKVWFGLRVAFQRHKKTHTGFEGKNSNDWQGFWSRAKQELKKTRPSKWQVFDSVSKCSDPKWLNHIVTTYYVHKAAIDGDTTSQVFNHHRKDLQYFEAIEIPEITLNGSATAVCYQDENTVQLSLSNISNASNEYSASDSGDSHVAPQSLHTAPVDPTSHCGVPDFDAPQTLPKELQGPPNIPPQNHILSHAGGGLDTNLNTPELLRQFDEAAKFMEGFLIDCDFRNVTLALQRNNRGCQSIHNFFNAYYRTNSQQMSSNRGSNGSDTITPNLHNLHNPPSFQGSQDLNTYNMVNAFPMSANTATIGSGHEMQPFTPHTVVPVNQNTTPQNPLNQQNLNSSQFSNQPESSSAAERIELWDNDSNSLQHRLYDGDSPW